MSAPVEFVDEVAGIYFRSIVIQFGERAKQHVHDYDHATLIGNGAAVLYVDGVDSGYFEAGQAVLIKAGQHHEFEARKDDTRLTCVHISESAQAARGA